jgi:hypothetical protein
MTKSKIWDGCRASVGTWFYFSGTWMCPPQPHEIKFKGTESPEKFHIQRLDYIIKLMLWILNSLKYNHEDKITNIYNTVVLVNIVIVRQRRLTQQGSIARVIGKCSFSEHLKLWKFSKNLLFGTLWWALAFWVGKPGKRFEPVVFARWHIRYNIRYHCLGYCVVWELPKIIFQTAPFLRIHTIFSYISSLYHPKNRFRSAREAIRFLFG